MLETVEKRARMEEVDDKTVVITIEADNNKLRYLDSVDIHC